MGYIGKKWEKNFNVEIQSITLLLLLTLIFSGIEYGLNLGSLFLQVKIISFALSGAILIFYLNRNIALNHLKHTLIFLYFAIQIAFYSYLYFMYNNVLSFKLISLTFSLLGYLFFRSHVYLLAFILFNFFHLLGFQILLDKYNPMSLIYLTICLSANYILYSYMRNVLLGSLDNYTQSFDSTFVSPPQTTYHA